MTQLEGRKRASERGVPKDKKKEQLAIVARELRKRYYIKIPSVHLQLRAARPFLILVLRHLSLARRPGENYGTKREKEKEIGISRRKGRRRGLRRGRERREWEEVRIRERKREKQGERDRKERGEMQMCRVTLEPVPNANRNASRSVLYANARDRSSALREPRYREEARNALVAALAQRQMQQQ